MSKKEVRKLGFKFIDNCHDSNLEGVRECLSQGVDVNTVSEDGYWSGLSIAATENNQELLEILLSHPDIKINNTTKIRKKINKITKIKKYKLTPLMVACEYGTPAIVSRLVQVPELDINYQDKKFGYTAALQAIMKGQTECVKILAETDSVDWNKTDRMGWTPLFEALRSGHSNIVDIIVQQPNIDFNVKTNNGETLAQRAVKGQNVKCVETLASQATFDCWNVQDGDGDTPIINAIKEKNTSIMIKLLLQCPRVDVNVKDKNGDSLYDIARKTGNADIIKLIDKPVEHFEIFQEEKELNSRKGIKKLEGEKEDLSPLTESKINDSALDVKKNMSKMQDAIMKKEELKREIKTKESQLSQKKFKSKNDVAVISEQVDNIETELKVSVDRKMKAEEEIRRLQNVIENCDVNITAMEKEKKTKAYLMESILAISKADQDNLTEEIESLRTSLESHIETVDNLMREEISSIKKNIKRKREEIENEKNNLDQLEFQLEENKREKLTGEYIEYVEPETKAGITTNDTVQDVEYMIKPDINKTRTETKGKQELKVELSKEQTVCYNYDLKQEPTVELEPPVNDVTGRFC